MKFYHNSEIGCVADLLTSAILNDNIKLAKWLLNSGLPFDFVEQPTPAMSIYKINRFKDSNNLLLTSVRKGYLDIIQLLVKNYRSSIENLLTQATYEAISEQQEEITDYLIKNTYGDTYPTYLTKMLLVTCLGIVEIFSKQ